jgi:signal transduction histidine kinase/DNA-binding response OmpR family regulator
MMSSPDRVLIIDDDVLIQDLLRACLAPRGYQMVFAGRGQEALELLKSGQFAVAILDIMLPEINGMEILRRVQGQIPETEIIVLTGHASLETAIEAIRLGAYDYITKPFSIDVVRSTVKRAIDKQRLQTRLAAIQDLSHEMALSLDVAQVAKATLDIVERVLELEHGELWLINEEQGYLYPVVIRGARKDRLPRLLLHGEKGITVVVAREGTALYVPDTQQDPRYLNFGTTNRSELAVPLKVKERVIGVLNVESVEVDAFNYSDERLLSTLAAQAAIAIENARLYESIQQELTERKRAEKEIMQRNRELAALNEIGQAITSSLDLQETLTLITSHTARLLDVMGASLILVDEADDNLLFVAGTGGDADSMLGRRLAIDQGIVGWVVQHGEPLLVADVTQDPRWFSGFDQEGVFTTHSILCVPLQSKGHTIGALEAINKKNGSFDQDDLWLLSSLAAPAATAIENARLFEQVQAGRKQLQALSRRLVDVQEAERGHISRELHDETGQALSSILLGLSLLEREAKDPEAVLSRATELESIVDDVLENLHRLAMNLRPASLDHLGLVPALEQYAETFGRQHNLTAAFEAVGIEEKRLPPAIETTLYRIVQEALTNVSRHAQASHVDVLLERRGDQVVTIIEDDGIGFDPKQAMRSGRLGLFGMQERVEMLSGTLIIESAVGKGTTVFVEVPYAHPDPDCG